MGPHTAEGGEIRVGFRVSNGVWGDGRDGPAFAVVGRAREGGGYKKMGGDPPPVPVVRA